MKRELKVHALLGMSGRFTLCNTDSWIRTSPKSHSKESVTCRTCLRLIAKAEAKEKK